MRNGTMSALSVAASTRSAARSTPLLSSQPTLSQVLSRMTGSRRRRFPRLRISPSRIIALRLRGKTDRQNEAYAGAFNFAARQRAERLPVLMLQAWMARQDTRDEPDVSQSIHSITASEWTSHYRDLAIRGWSKKDLDHWIWILSGEDGDARVQRLLSTETPKPIFLVLLLARSDERLRKAESMLSLMEYTSQRHFNPPSSPSSDGQQYVPDRKIIIGLSQFLVLLRRLVRRTQRLWPRFIVSVARFTAAYIQRIRSNADARSYHQKCEVFNTALQLFKKPAANKPVANMEFNWRAQRILLAMSGNMEKPLIINKASYRAVREVMIGLKKSATERAVALRYSKSWPPYRQDFDGLDAKKTPEDDYSRSVKAGIVMREAGYPHDDYDQALSALGGMGASSPTIQTRSLAPKQWKGEKEDRNAYSRWAMIIRATRNPQEAWKVFNNLAVEIGKPPNIQVYAEMFMKLRASPLHPHSTALPGDSRENLPIHDANYSEYELARLTPPTVSQLYDRMISQGVKPAGYCLHSLISNADSLEEATTYLHDGGINPASINALGLFKEPSYQALRQVPLLVFRSYIQLLCRLQPNRRGGEKLPTDELFRIRHAINLTRLRLRPETTEGSTFQPPWSIILRALARPHICLINDTQTNNDAEALSVSLDVIQSVQKRVGIDPDIFLYLCRTVQKVATSRLHSRESLLRDNVARGAPLVPSAETVLKTLKTLFSQLTVPVEMDSEHTKGLEVPQFVHSVGPAHLHAYMRALAFLEDTSAMKELLQWILTHRSYVDEEAERIDTRGHALVARTLCAFQAFAGPSLRPEEREDLIPRIENPAEAESSWRWPTPGEVDEYVQSDLRGGSQRLQQKILAKSWLAFQHQSEDARLS